MRLSGLARKDLLGMVAWLEGAKVTPFEEGGRCGPLIYEIDWPARLWASQYHGVWDATIVDSGQLIALRYGTLDAEDNRRGWMSGELVTVWDQGGWRAH